MSIFSSIASAIFGKGTIPGASSLVPGAPGAPAPQGTATAAPASKGTATASGAPAMGKAMTLAEVEAMIKKISDTQSEKLDWQRSIVDLMKALDIDSSLAARKELAKELGYTGDTNDSATMNFWLHKQVMAKLVANGGKLPSDVKW